MYITRVALKHVKCFEEEEIVLEQVGSSVLIAGNNGAGKSAIIRSIAMGLCDRDSAAALLRELSGNFVKIKANKEEENEAEIIIDLYDDEAEAGKEKFTVITKITEYPELIGETVIQTIVSPNEEEPIQVPESFTGIIKKCKKTASGKVNQNDIAQFIPWGRTFVTGYGPGLRTTGTAKFTEYFAPDAVYSIFKYDSPLQDPETAWRRIMDAARRPHQIDENKKYRNAHRGEKSEGRSDQAAQETSDKIAKLIKGVLGLHANERVVLEPNGIFVKVGDEKQFELIELDARGDGHKALTKVILDILIWYLLFKNYDENNQGDQRNWEPLEFEEVVVSGNKRVSVPEVRGIVIIDELEQHLHPTLQRQIVKNLNDILPNVQFIISTHSPLCLSGTCDVYAEAEEKYKVYSVYREGTPQKINEKALPFGKRADQILVDYFELQTTLSPSLEKKIDRYRELVKKEIDRGTLDQPEKIELATLEKEIAQSAPLIAEREDDRRIELKMMKSTRELEDLLEERKSKDD